MTGPLQNRHFEDPTSPHPWVSRLRGNDGTRMKDPDAHVRVFRLSSIVPQLKGNRKGCPYGKTRYSCLRRVIERPCVGRYLLAYYSAIA